MKNRAIFLFVLLSTSTAFTSCKKDNNSPGGEAATALVKDMVIAYGNSTLNPHFDYDSKKRDNSWTYSDLKIEKTFGSPQSTSSMILDTKGRVSQVDTKGLNGFGNYYKLNYTYDEQGRVKTLQISSRTENTDFEEESTLEFIYDGNNLVKLKKTYSQGDTYTITTFSGFTSEFKNSLGSKNFGFDFFGTASYPCMFMDSGGSGHSGATFYMFAGAELPGKYSTRTYRKSDNTPTDSEQQIYTYTYQKDSKGRITEIDAEYYTGVKETYRISYY